METQLLNESESLDQNESWIPKCELTSEDFDQTYAGLDPDYEPYTD